MAESIVLNIGLNMGLGLMAGTVRNKCDNLLCSTNPLVSPDVAKVGLIEEGGFAGNEHINVGDIVTNTLTVTDIINGVENGEIPLINNLQKGNYGEMKMDVYFAKQGYERISLETVTDINAPAHQGIDGVYYNPDGHPPYIIGEAKYGSSRLGATLDGKQMCDNWVDKRLVDAVGEEMADEIVLEMMLNPDNVQKQLINISNEGVVNVKILDENANIVK